MTAPLIVSEIFLSLQGEGSRAGLPCTLVRLAGCNLRCKWCDTPYAQTTEHGTPMTIDQVLAEVERLGCRRAELTGGEPLLQPAATELLRRLCDAGCETLLETNGSVTLAGVDGRVVKIVDVKCPSSGHADATLVANFALLTARDEVKFVLADRADYDFAKAVVAERGLTERCAVIFSLVYGRLSAAELARWVLDDALDVRVGLQLHKMIWPHERRGV